VYIVQEKIWIGIVGKFVSALFTAIENYYFIKLVLSVKILCQKNYSFLY